VLFERIRHTDRRFRQGALVTARVLRFHLLDAALELAHVLEVLVDTTAIGGAQGALERVHLAHHPVEDATVVLATRRAIGVVTAGAEEQVESGARIADHRQRLVRRRPADRVGVRAAVVVRAATRLIEILDAQLHAGDRRVLTDLARHDLVEAGAHEQIAPLGLLGVRLREEHRARPEVVAADFRRVERLGHAAVGVADDREMLTPVGERRQRAVGREFELTPHTLGGPEILRSAPGIAAGRAVHRLDAHEALMAGPGARGTTAQQAAGGLHGVEIRQGDGRAQSLQERAALERLLREKLHKRCSGKGLSSGSRRP